jgi:hypothetical protein
VRLTAYIARYCLIVPQHILDDNRLEIGDKITIVIDVNEKGKHPHPYIDIDLRYDEAEERVKQNDATWRLEARKVRSASGPCASPDRVLQIVQSNLRHSDFILSIALRVVEH